MSRKDFIIVCGDFGLWHNYNTERRWFKWLESKKFTLLFVDGNHENFDRLNNEFEVTDFHGGKIHKIGGNIYHLMRGYIFELCGKKFFTFGGARSQDIEDGILDIKDFSNDRELIKEFRRRTLKGEMLRINHISWWKEELPTPEEMDFGLRMLEKHNYKVDFIVSHRCPQQIASIISKDDYSSDRLTGYFNTVADKTEFEKWLFGHYHNNIQISDKFLMLYEQIIRIV